MIGHTDTALTKTMHLTKFVLVLFIGFCCLSSAASAQQEPLEYAYPDVSVWTTKRDKNGKLKNPLINLAAPLFEKAGVPWRAKAYPANRMFLRLREGSSKFSMLVNAKTALDNCCLISKDPVAVVEIRAYHKSDKPPIKTKRDLIGKRVITILGYSYAGLRHYIETNGIINNPAEDHRAAFAMLKMGRADYVIDYAFPAAEILLENPIEGIQSESISQTNVYLVLSKQYPRAREVMTKLEKIMLSLDKEDILNWPKM